MCVCFICVVILLGMTDVPKSYTSSCVFVCVCVCKLCVSYVCGGAVCVVEVPTGGTVSYCSS